MSENKEPICDSVRQAVCCGDSMTNSYLEHLKMCDECRKFWHEQNELKRILMTTNVPEIVEGSIADSVIQTLNEENAKSLKSVRKRHFYWQRYIGTAAAAVVILVTVFSSKVWQNFDTQNDISDVKMANDFSKQNQASISDIETKITAFDESESQEEYDTNEPMLMLSASPESVKTKSEEVVNGTADLYSDSVDDQIEYVANETEDLMQDAFYGSAGGGGSSAQSEKNASISQERVKEEVAEPELESMIQLFDMSQFDSSDTLAQNISFANKIVSQNHSDEFYIDANDSRLKEVSSKEFLDWIKSLDLYENYHINSLMKYLEK